MTGSTLHAHYVGEMPLAQFTPFVSQVSPSFWNALSQLKLNEYQLSDELIRIRADYTPQRTVIDRHTRTPLGAACRFRLDGDAFDVDTPWVLKEQPVEAKR